MRLLLPSYASPSSAAVSGGEERPVTSFPFPPDDGEPLSKQQAGPEAGVTVGHVGCHSHGYSWREGGQLGQGTLLPRVL